MKFIVPDEKLCVACKTCVIQCAMVHSSADCLADAMDAGSGAQGRIYIESVDSTPMPMQCRQCPDAPCIAVCPKDAMTRLSPDSPVLVDADACIGCRFCMIACPYGSIEMSRHRKIVVKCDQCVSCESPGGPACVESCPTGALKFVEGDEDEDEGKKVIACEREIARRVSEDSALHTDEPDDVKKIACEMCGCVVATLKQLQLIRSKLPDTVAVANICPACRRKAAARTRMTVTAEMEASACKQNQTGD